MIEQNLIQVFAISILACMLRMAAPLLFAALGQLFVQRSGVINVGSEEMMLTGAFVSFTVVFNTGNLLLGLLSGMAVGALWGLFLAYMSVNLHASQVVCGIGIGIASLGFADYYYRLYYI